MGSFIMLGIKPELIDGRAWQKTFRDIMEISKQGELSCKQEEKKYGVRYACNKLSEPVYDRQAAANRWFVSGDLVMGLTVDDFTLVDSIQYYRELAAKAEVKEDWAQADVGDICNGGYLVLWMGDTWQRRAHNWLLAIACIINHRFPNATYIYTASTPMDFIRATGLAGSIIGEPVEIPEQYRVGDITEPVAEMLDDMSQDITYDCKVATNLYYWDNPKDSVDPKLDHALKHYMEQFDEFSKKHIERICKLSEAERLSYMKDMFGEKILLPEKVWVELEEHISEDKILKPYLGLYSVDTSEQGAEQLVNLLATNYALFQYYWGNYLQAAKS